MKNMNDIAEILIFPKKVIKESNLKNFVISFSNVFIPIYKTNHYNVKCPFDDGHLYKIKKYRYTCEKCKRILYFTPVNYYSALIVEIE